MANTTFGRAAFVLANVTEAVETTMLHRGRSTERGVSQSPIMPMRAHHIALAILCIAIVKSNLHLDGVLGHHAILP